MNKEQLVVCYMLCQLDQVCDRSAGVGPTSCSRVKKNAIDT